MNTSRQKLSAVAAANFRALRTQHGMSLRALATAFGVTHTQVANYENPEIDKQLSTLQRYSGYFKIEPGKLLQ